jgi:hypothetical protein
MKRKIAAIFAADIAGYSRLVAEDEEGTLRRGWAARWGGTLRGKLIAGTPPARFAANWWPAP